MTSKLTAGMGVLLMAMTAMTPLAFAHYDSGEHRIGTDGNNERMPYVSTGLTLDDYTLCIVDAASATCDLFPTGYGEAGLVGEDSFNPGLGANDGTNDRVSGWYYGPAGVYVQATIPSGDEEDPEQTLFAGGGLMNCDFEVLAGDVNEEVVDDTENNDFVLADGTFNDGGQGGACHVGAGGYNDAALETPGCAQYTTNAFAEDAVFGSEVWTSATCDWKTPVVPDGEETPPEEIVLGVVDTATTFALCMANTVSGALPSLPDTDDFTAAMLEGVDCVQVFIDCTVGSEADTVCDEAAEGATFVCGGDNSADAGEWGEGDGMFFGETDPDNDYAEPHAPDDFASTYGVPFPAADAEDDCDDSTADDADSRASVFMFASLAVHIPAHDADDATTDVIENVGVPTYGWIA